MKMTQKLADELMDCLTCLAISALDGVRIDENGRPYVPEVLMESATTYARNTFIALTDDIAQNAGEEWEIIPSEAEE